MDGPREVSAYPATEEGASVSEIRFQLLEAGRQLKPLRCSVQGFGPSAGTPGPVLASKALGPEELPLALWVDPGLAAIADIRGTGMASA